jgi:uncharacterized protein (TIGR03382 family)
MKAFLTTLWLTLATCLVLTGAARAQDDYAWATTTGSTLALVDMTTGTTQQDYRLLISQNGRIQEFGGGQMRIANVNGTLYGIANGSLYTINTGATVLDQNKTQGYLMTLVGSANVNNVAGLTWNSDANVFDVSTGQAVYTLSLNGKTSTLLTSFGNKNVAGIAYSDGTLYGLQYSPSPGQIIESVNGASFTTLAGSSINGASGSGAVFFGASGILYADAGNNEIVAYVDGQYVVTGQPASVGNMQSFANAEGSQDIFGLSLTPTSTPEPSVTALLAVAVALLGWQARRRLRAA